jgi:hypothetical protein
VAEVELPKPDELHEPAANSFSRRVALVTAIYAVVLAIAPPSSRADTREKMEALLKKLDEEEKRYKAERKDIEKDAKKLEAMRDSFQARDPYFLVAEALLQIAIVMSSVSILARSGLIFSFSLILAVVAPP